MDWLRQIPMGQFVDGREGWLRRLDARLKLAWSLVFLLTPVLAGPLWRVALVLGLLLLTLISGLPPQDLVAFDGGADAPGGGGWHLVDAVAGR